jgi:hypothetical protein
VANEEHVEILRQGFKVWNAWRGANPEVRPDLIGTNLVGARRFQNGTDLSNADLNHANLSDAYLTGANLTGADLNHASLSGTYLGLADLSNADLTDATLGMASLSGANLDGANLTRAGLSETIFANVNLTNVIGLETCYHHGPSLIDYRTLKKSGPLPLTFLRGVGLPDMLMDYLPSHRSRHCNSRTRHRRQHGWSPRCRCGLARYPKSASAAPPTSVARSSISARRNFGIGCG